MNQLKGSRLLVDGLPVYLQRKPVKNVNFRIYPPDGRVMVSAPLRMSETAVRLAIRDRIDWIQRHRQRLTLADAATALRYRSGEMHMVAGKACKLVVLEQPGKPQIRLDPEGVLELRIPAGSDMERRRQVVEDWLRRRLQQQLHELVRTWEPVIGRSVAECRVKRMKTLWGSCSIKARRIWLNLELARRSPGCLEYVVVHEMVHLHERYHNRRFYSLMDRFLPDWRARRAELENTPLTDDRGTSLY
ncbi:MAG: M48 family metallopeptidase [Spirochaeta sp.]